MNIFFGPKIVQTFLYDGKPKQIEIHTKSQLYKQVKKQLNKKEIIIYINGQVCYAKDKLENFLQDQQPNPQLQMKVESFEWQDSQKKSQDKTIVTQNEEKIELQKINSILYQEIQNHKSQIKDLQSQLESFQQKLTIQNNVGEMTTSFYETVFDTTEKAQYYNQILTTKYEQKIKRLSFYSSRDDSIIRTQLSLCQFCQQHIYQDQLLLSCSHHYHEQCLQNLIEAQLVEKAPQWKCLCGQKISKQTLKLIDYLFAEKCILEMHHIELECIKQSQQYKFVKCKNRYCYFFYIDMGQYNSYCPMCLQ